jgi:hypothetical protein
MLHAYARQAVVMLLIVTLGSIGLPAVAHAGLIGTQTLIDLNSRQHNLTRVDRVLTRDAVRQQLVSLGVDPAQVQARVAALSDQELQRLNNELDTLPAGGVLALIGAVFVVLLILELVGVTNIFQAF